MRTYPNLALRPQNFWKNNWKNIENFDPNSKKCYFGEKKFFSKKIVFLHFECLEVDLSPVRTKILSKKKFASIQPRTGQSKFHQISSNFIKFHRNFHQICSQCGPLWSERSQKIQGADRLAGYVLYAWGLSACSHQGQMKAQGPSFGPDGRMQKDPRHGPPIYFFNVNLDHVS